MLNVSDFWHDLSRLNWIRVTFLICIAAGSFSVRTAGQELPSCNRQLLSRAGNRVNIGMPELTETFNSWLKAKHSGFTDLNIAVDGHRDLKVSGRKNGHSLSMSGPLQVTGSDLEIHATRISRDGIPVKGIMDIFDKELSDYLKLKTRSLDVRGNDLQINVDALLGLKGNVTQVQVHPHGITMIFSSPPCQ